MTDSLEREAARPAAPTPLGPPPGAARRTARPEASATLARWAAAGPAVWTVRLLLPASLLLWLLALPRVRLSAMGDLGLLQALPPLYFAGLVLLTLGFVTALYAPTTRHRWPAAYVLALILMVHATPSLLYPTLRYAWAWKHVAIVDAMLRHGGTVPGAGKLDVYNQWPGFFELHALVLRATGVDSVLGYASWYPVLANVLLVGPLLLLYRSVTRDRRLVWGGVWIYFATAWVGQDYFSPQAFAYLLCLTVIALVVRRLAVARALAPPGPQPKRRGLRRRTSDGRAPDGRAPEGRDPDGRAPAVSGTSGARAVSPDDELSRHGGWRPGPFALLLVLIAAIVTSHQLTPIMLAATLALLALPRRNRRTVLPVLAAVVAATVLWDATVARPFVSENIGSLLAALGSPDHNAVSGLAQLGTAAPGQVLASWADRALTAGVLLLAMAAVARHRWLRRSGLLPVLVAPLVLLAANAYEGEMIFRAYLFALPAAAFFTAALLWGDPDRPPRSVLRTRLRAGVATTVLLALLAGLQFGYFAKERMNYFTPQEVAAVRYVTATPAGSRIVSLTANEPGGELRYDDHNRLVLADAPGAELRRLADDPLNALRVGLDDLNEAGGPSYLILTRAQLAECELTGLLPPAAIERVLATAATAPYLKPVFADSGAVVYQYVDPETPHIPLTGGTP